MSKISMPQIFSVETVLGCNLRCVECAIGAKLVNRKYGMMSYETFDQIAQKIEPYCKMLYLHIWGEPLLNRDIIPMIKRASRFSRTNISTNANMLDKEYAEQLISSGVSEIIVSIDGISQEVYEQYRVKGDLNKALMGLTHLVARNIKTGNRVAISPQFIVFEHNKHEMAEFAAMCKSLNLVPSFKAPYLRKNSILKDSGIPGLVRDKSSDLLMRKKKMATCKDPQDVFTILLDGSVVPCCYDHNGDMIMGNILNDTVEEIWHSEKYNKFRNDMASGNIPDFCQNSCLQW